MDMISFRILEKNEADNVLPILFQILHSNMSLIAPTGNDYQYDLHCWLDAVTPAIQDETYRIILIYHAAEIVGYFEYSLYSSTFMMCEIQFQKNYQGKGLFRQLYSYLFEIIPPDTLWVEAYSDKQNHKAHGILEHLGLKIIGENKNGLSYHFRGDYHEMLQKYGSISQMNQ